MVQFYAQKLLYHESLIQFYYAHDKTIKYQLLCKKSILQQFHQNVEQKLRQCLYVFVTLFLSFFY